MKIRSGFVSNSSSSSFVFVGFPRNALTDVIVDIKAEVTAKISIREINKFALDYFENDEEYSEFLNGNVPDKFWKDLRERFSGEFDDYTVPDGYDVRTIPEGGKLELYLGINVASVFNDCTVEIDVEDIIEAQKKIKKDYPKITSRTILVSQTD